jgi:hypothetical protein
MCTDMPQSAVTLNEKGFQNRAQQRQSDDPCLDISQIVEEHALASPRMYSCPSNIPTATHRPSDSMFTPTLDSQYHVMARYVLALSMRGNVPRQRGAVRSHENEAKTPQSLCATCIPGGPTSGCTVGGELVMAGSHLELPLFMSLAARHPVDGYPLPPLTQR